MWTETTWRLQPKTLRQATMSVGEEDNIGWMDRSVVSIRKKKCDSFIEALSRMMSSFYFLVFNHNGTFFLWFLILIIF